MPRKSTNDKYFNLSVKGIILMKIDFSPVKKAAAVLAAAVILVSLSFGAVPCRAGGELVQDAQFYVSPNGSDNNSGSFGSPFATIQKARNAVAILKQKGKLPKGGLKVAIMAGEYAVRDGLNFGKANSGTAVCPVTYCAYGNGEVSLNGGVTLDNGCFRKVSGDAKDRLPGIAAMYVKECDLKALGITAADYGKLYAFGSYNTASKYDGDTTGPTYSELFWNGERMTLARYPNGNDYLETGKIYDNGDTSETYGNGTTQNPGWNNMRNPRGGTFGINCILKNKIKNWETTDDVWLFGFFKYDWADSATPIASVDLKAKKLTTKYASCYGFNKGARYYIYNSLEELDAKGEWYLDRTTGMLYVYPPDNIKKADIQITLTVKNIISCSADYITFQGITVKGTRGSGIVMCGSNDSVIGCTVTDVAGNGITMQGNNNLADRNTVFHVGASGIEMSGGDRKTLTPSNSTASNNLVRNWSEVVKTYRSAIGAGGTGITICHNEMYDAPHLAVLYGGNDIVIEYNKIHDVCKETIDGGAVYAGRNWTMQGCVVRYNYFNEINAEIGDPVALYFDDALSGQTAYGNVFNNIKGIGILAGGGRDLAIANNVFIDVGTPVSYDDRARDGFVNNGWFAHMVVPENSTMWANLAAMPYKSKIWRTKYPSLAKISTDRSKPDDIEFACNPSHSIIANNVLYSSGKELGNIADSVYTYSTVGENKIYRVQNPGFVSLCKDNFAFKDDAKAFDDLPGFVNIPFGEIGIK
mgnify:CR=1 FL=1